MNPPKTNPPKVLEARFALSSPTIGAAPPENVSEIVFLGRSNVGKSSLLNALCARKGLAKTSGTPGKTRLINFFDVTLGVGEERLSLRLVDLPGFGYAKVSKSEQAEWQKGLAEFLKLRRSIRVFVRLIDSRHPELPQDRLMYDFVQAVIRPDQSQLAVFTKADKLNRKERDALLRKFPGSVLVSSTANEGVAALWEKLLGLSFMISAPQEGLDGAR
ncbi:MAG: ribosome biogenesis GTP-binding protein YihA/YsxC [Campylobacterales bacterium]